MIKFLLILMILGGCANTPDNRTYNHDDEQDKACYGKYGGMHGYCDVLRHGKDWQK